MGSYLSKSKQQSIKAPVLDFWQLSARDIDQNLVQFRQFKGKKAILIVNVASHCYLTESNYRQLDQMRQEFKDQGLQVLAFPCNQFEQAEKGSNQQIKKFVQEKYGVKFPLFQKVLVNTEDLHPVYSFIRENSSLYDEQTGDTRKIQGNFTIFLVNGKGEVVKCFQPSNNLEPVRIEVQKLVLEKIMNQVLGN